MPRQYTPRVNKVCERCGNPFAVPANRAATATYCSRTCKYARPERGLVAAFWGQVARPIEGCWERRTRQARGVYGEFKYAKRVYAAHRLAYELTYGPIPDGMLVCHHCDNRRCCRPDHLFLGTAAANSRDMVEKGRSVRGERQRKAKLTEDEVRRLRDRAQTEQVSYAGLARAFGITTSTARRIALGLAWKHVT